MEGYDWTFHRGRKPSFDDVSEEHRFRAFDVDYAHLRGTQSGDLFVTRWGWPVVDCLTPERWFVGQRFSRVGRALAGATGAVYRVPVAHPPQPDWALVAKFCRFGQDTLVTRLDPEIIDDPSLRHRFAGAEFLSPFEEFGNVQRLHAGAGARIRTQRPLAIYAPPTRYLDWELGRKSSLRDGYCHRLRENQSHSPSRKPVEYEWERIYVLLYNWINGMDAAQACQSGLLDKTMVNRITMTARDQLMGRGWVVLDHKPNHLIVRTTPDGREIVCREGLPVWAIVDYELLLPLGAADGQDAKE